MNCYGLSPLKTFTYNDVSIESKGGVELKFPCAKINSIGLSFLYNFLGIRTVRSILHTFLDISSHNLHISLNQEIWIFFQCQYKH